MDFTDKELALPKEDWKILLNKRGYNKEDLPKYVTTLRRKILNRHSAKKSVCNRKNKMVLLETYVLKLQDELKEYKYLYDEVKLENTVLLIENDTLRNGDNFLNDLGFDL
jgi:hypothetical protein